MLNSKYASANRGKSKGTERAQKYALNDLHKSLGLEEPNLGLDEPNTHYQNPSGQPTPIKYNENEYHDEDMMDLDDEKEVSLVSDMIIDHRSHHEYRGNEPMDLDLAPTDQISMSQNPTKKSVFVVDTNFIVSHLNTLEQLRLLSTQYNHQILIPTTVIQELDGLKNSGKSAASGSSNSDYQNLGKLARAANDWIYGHLANLESSVAVQKLNQRHKYNLVKDDAILECCLYFANTLHNFVILLSNDKNLCLRALTEQILTVSYRKGMSANLIASKVYQEKVAKNSSDINPQYAQQIGYSISDRDIQHHEKFGEMFQELAVQAYHEFLATVIKAVDHTMIDIYGEDLSFTSYDKDEMIDFVTVGKTVHNHYTAVFSEFFKGSPFKKNDWKHLPDELTAIPLNPIYLKTFVTFWSNVIEYLYPKEFSVEGRASRSFINDWIFKCSAFDLP